MKYEVVNMDEKFVVGVSAETGNDDPEMPQIIGGLWKRFYGDGVVSKVNEKKNAYAIGLYSDYTPTSYTVTVGCEASNIQPETLSVKKIPAGRYAKFNLHGDMVQTVQNAWSEIWQMDLKRTFTGDYEEYYNADAENADIALFIAIE